ncbi:MAG: 3'-5' exonuclease [Candidatus Thiodiazotropha sp.]
MNIYSRTIFLSGWGHVIGMQTKRCLNFSTRKKSCKKCAYYTRLGKKIPQHDCRQNWKHSAKAMESDIAVQLHSEAQLQGMKFKSVIGDEDSASIKHIRDKVNSDVEKFSDISHIKRSLSNRLAEMHKTHKSLTEMVRTGFVKNFTYAVHQNKDKTEESMRVSLQAIVPHMYGEHSLCGTWCRSGEEKYKHSSLPYGKDLSDVNLREALEKVLDPFIKHPKKLMTTGNTQLNESLNNTAWSKAPKIRNYNMSESFDYRCAAAVCQFNDGKQYVTKVIENGNLTPRKETRDYNRRQDEKRKYHKVYKSEKINKKRRIQLRKERKQKELTSSVKSGISYQTDCLINEETLDTYQIPDPIQSSPLKLKPELEMTKIYVDTETTKLGYDAEITQLSAYINDNKTFNCYIMPQGFITEAASEITGLKIKVSNGIRSMYHNGQKVPTVNLQDGLNNFLQWLDSLPLTQKILVAHNGNSFDFPILVKYLENEGLLRKAETIIAGVCDSLPFIRRILPNRKSYKLENVFLDLLDSRFDSHNAISDAKALADIFQKLHFQEEEFLKHSSSFENAVIASKRKVLLNHEVNKLANTLTKADKCVVSHGILKKICQSGITYEMLKLAYERDKESGIRLLFTERVNNSARITNRKSIINSVNDFFRSESE